MSDEMGTLNSREWKTQEWKSWHHNEWVEIAGVEFSAPNIKAGKCGSGNLGKRKSMESEGLNRLFLTVLTENRVIIFGYH